MLYWWQNHPLHEKVLLNKKKKLTLETQEAIHIRKIKQHG